jgi:hypothetical protein
MQPGRRQGLLSVPRLQELTGGVEGLLVLEKAAGEEVDEDAAVVHEGGADTTVPESGSDLHASPQFPRRIFLDKLLQRYPQQPHATT